MLAHELLIVLTLNAGGFGRDHWDTWVCLHVTAPEDRDSHSERYNPVGSISSIRLPNGSST